MLCNTVIIIVGGALAAFGGILKWGAPVWQSLLTNYIKPLLDANVNMKDADWAVELAELPVVPGLGLGLVIVGGIIFAVGLVGYLGACCTLRVLLYTWRCSGSRSWGPSLYSLRTCSSTKRLGSTSSPH
jgi:hypothetical protein